MGVLSVFFGAVRALVSLVEAGVVALLRVTRRLLSLAGI